MNKKYIIFLIILLLVIFSCQKKIDTVNIKNLDKTFDEIIQEKGIDSNNLKEKSITFKNDGSIIYFGKEYPNIEKLKNDDSLSEKQKNEVMKFQNQINSEIYNDITNSIEKN